MTKEEILKNQNNLFSKTSKLHLIPKALYDRLWELFPREELQDINGGKVKVTRNFKLRDLII